MSDSVALSADTSLWDPMMKVKWGLHDFCPVVTNFHMHTVMQVWLKALSQVGAWGDLEKPQQDMVFHLIVPSLAIGCERVFGLITMWAHPHQAHFQTPEEVAHKLVL